MKPQQKILRQFGQLIVSSSRHFLRAKNYHIQECDVHEDEEEISEEGPNMCKKNVLNGVHNL